MSKKTAPATPAEQIQRLPTGVLVASPWNRKNFDPAKLQELADTIQANDVQQPLIVRVLPGDRLEETRRDTPRGRAAPTHEIVAGERRWRAAMLCGLATVPVIVRELSDAEALDTQMLENLQRVNLTALEEGEAYEHRMSVGGLTTDQIAAKIGRSREYVYTKLKLLDLCAEAKQALRDETIEPSTALRIARVPDGKLQLKALEYATTPKPGASGDLPSVREFQVWLRQNVMLQLNAASFKITDARLVETAGSCKDCSKRTGASPDIFSDVDGADICTDPPCFNNKTTAHRAALMARAEAKGMRVIDGAEAKKICNANSSALKGYSSLTQARHDVESADEPAQLGKLLGKDAPAPVLIENPWTKELIEAVPTEEAEAVLIAKGLIKTTTAVANQQDEQARLDSAVARLKQGMQFACESGARKAVFDALQAAIRSTPDDKAPALVSAALIRAWLTDQLYHLDHDDTAVMLQVELDPENYSTTAEEAARLRLQGCDNATLFKALALFIIMEDRDATGSSAPTLFEAMAGTTRTNLDAVRKASDKAVKARISDQIRELTDAHKKAQKQPVPTAPLAQPEESAPAVATDGAKPRLKKQKLSGEEAQLGIAHAMQGMGEVAAVPAAGTKVDAWPFPGTFAQDRAAGQCLDTALEVGKRVTVCGPMTLRPMVGRFAGLSGVITAAQSADHEWEVKLDKNGRGGGVRLFLTGEIEADATPA